ARHSTAYVLPSIQPEYILVIGVPIRNCQLKAASLAKQSAALREFPAVTPTGSCDRYSRKAVASRQDRCAQRL
ncbi:MAG: hypothetical protein ACLR2O_12530, partial [Coprococcus sp.]